MNIKKLVVIDEKPIGVIFNPLTMQLIIGGPNKSYTTILILLESYFKLEPTSETVQNSKCKLVVENCKRSDYARGITALADEGIILTDVTEFGRLMR